MSEYNLAKSVKRMTIDPKKAPKKIMKKEEKNKINSNFSLLKSKEKLLADKESINRELMNSKLLEPLIEDRLREKKNAAGPGKNSAKHGEINNYYNNIVKDEIAINISQSLAESVELNPNPKQSKKKFGKEKKFSPNAKAEVKEEVPSCEKEEEEEAYQMRGKGKTNNISNISNVSKNPKSSKTKSSLLSQIGERESESNNSLINKLLSQSSGSNNFHMNLRSNENKMAIPKSMTQLFSKSKKKTNVTKTSKRKADNLTSSDDERLNVGSRKKHFR